MARQRSHSIAFKRQVAQEFIAGNIIARRLVVQVSQTENKVALDVSDRFAERSESGAKLRGEKLRLLPGGEVPALVDLVEINQVAIGAPGPCLREVDRRPPEIP